jgi:hypothetical protein
MYNLKSKNKKNGVNMNAGVPQTKATNLNSSTISLDTNNYMELNGSLPLGTF